MSELIKTAPAKIYLCVGDDDEVLNDNFHDLGDVCWAENRATNYTIEYVRADIRADVLALCDAIDGGQNHYLLRKISERLREAFK